MPSGRAATSTFDAQGKLLAAEQPGVTALTYRYDSYGRPIEATQGERSATSTYSAAGWLATSTDALGHTTSYTRDTLGRITQTILPDGRTVAYDYDTAGNMTKLTAPGRAPNVFGFSPAGSRISWTAPAVPDAGDSTEYRYDADGDISSIVRPDATTIDIDRDSAGRATQVAHASGTVGLRYGGPAGRLDQITHGGGQTVSWTHDGDVPLTETASGLVAGQVTRQVDGEGRLTSSTVTGTDPVTYAYDSGGLVSRGGQLDITRAAATGFIAATALGSSTSSHTYDSYADSATLAYKHADSTIYSEAYERDRGARITERGETIAGQDHTYAYEYSQAGRLTRVTRNGTLQATYGYDQNGNRTSEDHAGAPAITADYDAQDRLTRHGSTTYRYTANGDLRAKIQADDAQTSYAYDASGSLRTVGLPDGRHLRYLIDGMGRRVGRETDGQLDKGFVYGEGPRPSAELTATGTIRSRFVYATRSTVPDYMIRGGNTYRFVTDHHGSPRLIVDTTTGDIAQRIDYDAFGRVQADSNPGFQPFGYAGGLYDTDTGLVRFGARDYDPHTGRWTTKDPIDYAAGDTNLYGYVFSDPINYTDPSGLSLFEGFTTRLAGAYDGVTFGTTDRIRDWIGNNNVDRCSMDYKLSRSIGNLTGAVAIGTATGTATAAWLSGLGVSWFNAGVAGGAFGGFTETMVRTGYDASVGQVVQGTGLGIVGGAGGKFLAGPQKLVSEGTEGAAGLVASLSLDAAIAGGISGPSKCGC